MSAHKCHVIFTFYYDNTTVTISRGCSRGFFVLRIVFVVISPNMNDDCETENGNKETSIQPFKKSIKKTDIISYTCDVCSKEFEKKDRLTRHKFIYLETKPYSCEVWSIHFSIT